MCCGIKACFVRVHTPIYFAQLPSINNIADHMPPSKPISSPPHCAGEARGSANDPFALSHPAAVVSEARTYMHPDYAHPAVEELHRLLRKGLRGTLVPFEIPNKLPVADTRDSATSDTSPSTRPTSKTVQSPREFVYDDLFEAHVQWMGHVAELQPPMKELYAAVKSVGDDSNKESTRAFDSESDHDTQPSTVSSDSEANTHAATTNPTSYSPPPAFSFSSSRRSHVFDELQRNSKSLLKQKQDTQRDYDRKLRKHQLDAFRADFGDRECKLAAHTEEVRQAWIVVLPTLRLYGAPNTSRAQRTLQWLCDQNVVPSNYTGCLDIGAVVTERLAPLCPVIVTMAVSAQLIEFIPWASGGSGMPSPCSAPLTDPVWMCGRLALAAGTLSTVAPHIRRLGTSATCIRSEVVLGTVAMWTCGASVAACVTTGAVVQGLAWYAGSNARQAMHDMWETSAK